MTSKVEWAGVAMSKEKSGGRALTDDPQGVLATSLGWAGWNTDPATGTRSDSGDP